MNTLYLECNMGAAGDMLSAALYELLDETQKRRFLDTMNRLIPGVTVAAEKAVTCGIAGTHMAVEVRGQSEHSHDVALGAGEAALHEHPHDHEHGHHHHHSGPAEIRAILDSLDVAEDVRQNAAAVYDRIAAAEAKAHGVDVALIHFHEVGALDAVADVTAVCLAMSLLRPDEVVVSPVHVGCGQVRCAHGIMPVPAPATAHLLSGIPTYGGAIQGELCTPTGAALLAHFGRRFGPQPPMTVERVGVGVGAKEFPAANCVRAFWGQSCAQDTEEICELVCHIDDMTAEALSYAADTLRSKGALDVAVTPLLMKQGRPAAALTVLCRPEEEAALARAVLAETSTLGVRVRRCRRYVLTPSVRTVDTAYGPMAVKRGEGHGICKEKPEYRDVARAAREQGLPFGQVWEDVAQAAAKTKEGTRHE